VSSRFARLVNAAQPHAKEDGGQSNIASQPIKDTPSITDSPSTEDSRATLDSPSLVVSQSSDTPPSLPGDSPSIKDTLTTQNSLSNEDSQILSIIPQVKGHTELPHMYTDHLARWLSADEQAVYVQLYRLSWGWGKDICFISNPRLSERSGVPETSMRRAVKKLISKHLVEKTDRVFGSKTEQGIEYRVFPMNRLTSSDRASRKDSPSNVVPNKERLLKETDQKGIDASRCTDCMGTNFYYPAGKEKGVARCEHKRLK
jgi:hypothetical protein